MARQFLVLDDHPFVHTALLQMLADLEPGARISLTHRLEQALSSLRQHPAPDLLLADLHLPDANGPEVIARLRQQRPEVEYIDVVGGAQHERHVVLDEDDRQAELVAHLLDPVAELAPLLAAGAGQRFVEHEDRRVGGQDRRHLHHPEYQGA